MASADVHVGWELAPLDLWHRGVEEAVALYFHKGALLSDPHGLLSGDGKYTRLIPGDAFNRMDLKALRHLMADAVAKQTLMLDDSPKK